MPTRCAWCLSDPLYIQYHDEEWGVPVHDDQKLFEFLILEGAQAGLSWLTILKRRENYRRAFCHFDPQKVVRLTEKDVERLMQDQGIIRNRLKIQSTILNAAAFLKIQEEFESFNSYLWGFKTAEALSRDLKQRGFKFVGVTIVYAFMQAIGMVNDHAPDCFKKATAKT